MTDQKKFSNFDRCEKKCNQLRGQLKEGDPHGLVRDQAGIDPCFSFDAAVFWNEGTCSITTIMKDADGYEEQDSVPVCVDGNPKHKPWFLRHTIEGAACEY